MSGEAKRLTDGKTNEIPHSLSPDGKRLAISQSGNARSSDIFILPIEVDSAPGPAALRLGKAELFLGTPFGEYVPAFSAGGRWPLYSRDGREPLFQTEDRRVMAASYTVIGESFAAAQPRLWTEARLRTTAVGSGYDLAPGGKRLAAILADHPDSDRLPTHLTFLLNLTDELRRKVPQGK